MLITEVNMVDKCAEALEKLTTIFQEGERPSFQEAIERRLEIFWQWLKRKENQFLFSAVEDFQSSSDVGAAKAGELSFRFSTVILALLTCLRHALEQVRAQDTTAAPASAPSPVSPAHTSSSPTAAGSSSSPTAAEGAAEPAGRRSTSSAAAALPPDVLSVSRQRLTARSVQLVVVLAVLPALPRGVGVPLRQRSEVAADVREAVAGTTDPYQRRDQALFALDHLLPLIGDRSLRDSVVTSHLGDVIALLLLVTSAPLARDGVAGMTPERRRAMEEQRERWKPALERLLDEMPQSRVVSELLLLQRCAVATSPPRRWVHERCTWWLFRVVGRPGGLARATEGLLHFWGQDKLDDVDDARIQAVAKMLVSPHPAYKNTAYFSHLASEVLSLLRIRRPEVRVSTLRVAAALTACLWDCTEAADSVQRLILQPLLGFLLPDSDVTLPTEDDVTWGVTSAWQLFVAGMEPGSPCLSSLKPYAGAMFQLYAAIFKGVSHLKSPCRELLERIVRHADSGVDVLDQMLLAQGLGGRRRFTAGDAGGAAVEAVPDDEADNWLLDDGGAAEAFVALLCGASAPEMVSDVFRSLLQRLSEVMTLSFPVSPNHPGNGNAEKTLRGWEAEVVAKQLSFRRGLLTLHTLAALAESEQARSALDDPSRLLPVIGTLLETFASSSEDAEVSESLLRVETVCLAMGVAAGMLGRESTTSAVWETARQLLPSLETLQNDVGGVTRVKDMARDLRQLVLTNGVVDHHIVTQDRYSVHRAAGHHSAAVKTEPGAGLKPEEHWSSPTSTNIRTHPEHTSVKPDPDQKPATSTGHPCQPSRVPPVPSADDPAYDASVTYQRAMYDLVDPLLPVRAHALTALTQLLQRRDPETWQHRKQLLSVFQEKLTDEDSYVYLAAVRGLACLADLCTDQLVAGLCGQYTGTERDADTRLKLGEVLLSMVRNLGELAPQYRAPLLNAFLAGCRDPDHLLRASSLSNLAELCRLLRYALSGVVHEIFGCLSALVDTDPAIEVRRAAVLVVSQLLDGLGADALKVLEDLLSPLYRKLKALLRREEDPALLQHVHTALDKLEVATRAMLFPERKLEKRITVLGAP